MITKNCLFNNNNKMLTRNQDDKRKTYKGKHKISHKQSNGLHSVNLTFQIGILCITEI